MSFIPELALYVCLTAAHYYTTPETECVTQQQQAAQQIRNPTPYVLDKATRRNWKGDIVGMDYVYIAKYAK